MLRLCAAALAVLLFMGPLDRPVGALAMAPTADTAPAKARDARYVEAEKAVKAKDWAKAIALLEQVIAATPRDADALNYLGYSYRKQGDKAKALTYYTRALESDPNHLGANEYLGELYLQMNEVAKAEERLAHLARICNSSCEEYRELRDEIAKFKAGKPRS